MKAISLHAKTIDDLQAQIQQQITTEFRPTLGIVFCAIFPST